MPAWSGWEMVRAGGVRTRGMGKRGRAEGKGKGKSDELIGMLLGMLKVVKETKSWLPFKAWLECLRLAKQIDSSFVYYGSLEFLEKDIENLRKEFNIPTPKIYNEYYQKHILELSNTH